jgi:nitrogen fixation protein NifU and related proteins
MRKADALPEANPTAFPEKIVERLLNTTGFGQIPNADGYARAQRECGDSVEVFLIIRDRRIREARFDTPGCGYTIACGSAAVELAEGKTLAEAMRITPEQISDALGGLPASEFHCAELAAAALRKAVHDYAFHGKDTWKKLYRR